MFKTKRIGNALLIVAMITGMLAGIVASLFANTSGTIYASLETSGMGIKAQQITKSRANEINALAYTDIKTYAPETRQLVTNTGLYRQTKVDTEISNPDGSKSTTVTVDVFRSSSDTNPIFSLPITLSNKADSKGIPTGTVIWFASLSPPDGFLICNGQSTAPYPELAKVVGATVPNLQGAFIRGYGNQDYIQNNGSTIGNTLTTHSSGAFKIPQGDAIRNITGSFGNSSPLSITGAFYKIYNSREQTKWGNVTGDGVMLDASRVVPISIENRPFNIALLPCIKT